jgi:ElaB/YqjD/DUF883 family membrane-anchored ribosome-binding protein
MNRQQSTDPVGQNRDSQGEPAPDGIVQSAGQPMQEIAGRVAGRAKDSAKNLGQKARAAGDENIERIKEMARKLSEQARAMAGEDNVERAKEMARNLREQARAFVGDENIQRAKTVALEQSQRTRELVDRGVRENPYATLLIAGAIGYGIAYLVHGRD